MLLRLQGVRDGDAHFKALYTCSLSFQKVSISKAGLHGRQILPHPRRGQPSPSAARPEPPARSIPVCVPAGRRISSSSAAGLGPAALHAPGRLSLRFGPGDWVASDPLAGGRTRRHRWRYAPHGLEPPASRPRFPNRCPRRPVLTTAVRLPEALCRSLFTGRWGLSVLPYASSGGARWEAHTIGQLGTRNAGIPRSGLHSN